MANKYMNQGANPSRQTGGEGGSNTARGTSPSSSMPEKTASWPGLPGPTQKRNRANGFPEEKVYPVAVGLRGGSDSDQGESKES